MGQSQLLLNKLRLCSKLHGSIQNQWNQLNYHPLIIFGKSKMATSKMAFLCYLAPRHHFVPVVTFDQPLYSKATEIILDSPPCSLLETIVFVVGGIHTFVNWVLSDWYTDGQHRTKLAFQGYYITKITVKDAMPLIRHIDNIRLG